ncbi:Fur family transcriptional regulator [Scatolibacter rhodanostii]|uniref:Fur family transcriptional regulator n=1 Tax=Scatolibacter rhodanostii TaxID=2014781 RepID=UPI000C08BEBE|nr:transcriptional repressor [Scatolibacter rhodanostii]
MLQSWPVGLKKTKQREYVLTALENIDRPMSAVEIYDLIQDKNENINLSTVYRILELLEEKGLIFRVSRPGSETILYEKNRFHHKHYAVCLKCHKMISIVNCPMQDFVPTISETGFQVLGHSIEVYGYCEACSSHAK